jgi:hypothetical protein
MPFDSPLALAGALGWADLADAIENAQNIDQRSERIA